MRTSIKYMMGIVGKLEYGLSSANGIISVLNFLSEKLYCGSVGGCPCS